MAGSDAPDGREPAPPRPPAGDLSARLKRLDDALDAKEDAAVRDKADLGRSGVQASGLARAFRMSTEFIAGIIAGAGLGWLFDWLLGTSPFGLIVFLMLGFAAGVFNLLRAAGSDSKPKDP